MSQHKEISLDVDPGYNAIDFNLYYSDDKLKIVVGLRPSSGIYKKAVRLIKEHLSNMHSKTFLNNMNIVVK